MEEGGGKMGGSGKKEDGRGGREGKEERRGRKEDGRRGKGKKEEARRREEGRGEERRGRRDSGKCIQTRYNYLSSFSQSNKLLLEIAYITFADFYIKLQHRHKHESLMFSTVYQKQVLHHFYSDFKKINRARHIRNQLAMALRDTVMYLFMLTTQ